MGLLANNQKVGQEFRQAVLTTIVYG